MLFRSDYTTRGKVLSALEEVLPFSTFKVNNMYYWLTKVADSKNTTKIMRQLAKDQGAMVDTEDDALEYARKLYYTKLFADKELAGESIDNAAEISLKSVITPKNDFGTSQSNIGTSGGLQLNDQIYVKAGNTFYEAIELVTQLAMTTGE